MPPAPARARPPRAWCSPCCACARRWASTAKSAADAARLSGRDSLAICFLPARCETSANRIGATRNPMAHRPIRIAVLYFAHETVTFLKNDTTLDDFVYQGSPAKGESLLAHDPRSYMGGFVKVAREFDGVELVGIESPLFPKTGTGSGWITREAYETFVGRMIDEIAASGPYDGVYLSLHGAMGVRGNPRPEADIA